MSKEPTDEELIDGMTPGRRREVYDKIRARIEKDEAATRERYHAVCRRCKHVLSREQFEGDACPFCGGREADRLEH